jgi:hypothetical protein
MPLSKRSEPDRFGVLTPVRLASEPLPSRKRWRFTPTSRNVNPQPRWEIGISGIVLPARQSYFGRELTTDATFPGQQRIRSPFDDGPDSLYVSSTLRNASTSRAFGFRSLYVELAHQFPNGIRLSGGLAGLVWRTRNYDQLDEVLPALTEGQEFTQIETSTRRNLNTTLAFQYTFFRRRRFRVSPGFSLIGNWMHTTSQVRFHVRDGMPPSGSQTSNTFDNDLWSSVELYPSLHLQYQLSRRLVVAGDVLPGIGVGLRYHLD